MLHTLALHGIRAFNVPDVDSKKGSGASDPYVHFELLEAGAAAAGDASLEPHLRGQTRHLENQLDPVWEGETVRLLLPEGTRPAAAAACGPCGQGLERRRRPHREPMCGSAPRAP